MFCPSTRHAISTSKTKVSNTPVFQLHAKNFISFYSVYDRNLIFIDLKESSLSLNKLIIEYNNSFTAKNFPKEVLWSLFFYFIFRSMRNVFPIHWITELHNIFY